MSLRQRIAAMSEGDLEGRYAELSFGIENGEYSGDVLAEAIRERKAVWQEILRARLGGVDDDEPMECDAYERYLEQVERSFMGLDEF